MWSAFEASAHCGAVVRLAETERVSRLLARLADELDRRSSGASCEPVVVVVIDGYAALRDAVGDLAHGEAARRLDRLLRDGPAVGMVAVVTTDGVSSAGLGVPRAATWRFEGGVPGRMRVVESGLEGQVVFDPDAARTLAPAGPATRSGPSAGRAAPVLVLPDVVDPDEFDTRVARCARGVVARGVRSSCRSGSAPTTSSPSWLRVPVGDHVFIGGAARTGRSTALRQVEFAWRRAHPGGTVVHVDRRRPVDGDLAAKDDPAIDPRRRRRRRARRRSRRRARPAARPARRHLRRRGTARSGARRVRALDAGGGAKPLRADHDVDGRASTASCSAPRSRGAR